MYQPDQYGTRRLSAAVQRRRRVAFGVLALALIVVVGFVAGHVVGSSSKSGDATKALKPAAPAVSSSSGQAAQEAARARERRAARRRAEKRRAREQAAQSATTPPAAAAPTTAPARPTPHVNTPQGQRALRQDPDCQDAPPPPKGYKGPVQC
jgi:FtsZ-interacting cell division protein ZipA